MEGRKEGKSIGRFFCIYFLLVWNHEVQSVYRQGTYCCIISLFTDMQAPDPIQNVTNWLSSTTLGDSTSQDSLDQCTMPIRSIPIKTVLFIPMQINAIKADQFGIERQFGSMPWFQLTLNGIGYWSRESWLLKYNFQVSCWLTITGMWNMVRSSKYLEWSLGWLGYFLQVIVWQRNWPDLRTAYCQCVRAWVVRHFMLIGM